MAELEKRCKPSTICGHLAAILRITVDLPDQSQADIDFLETRLSKKMASPALDGPRLARLARWTEPKLHACLLAVPDTLMRVAEDQSCRMLERRLAGASAFAFQLMWEHAALHEAAIAGFDLAAHIEGDPGARVVLRELPASGAQRAVWVTDPASTDLERLLERLLTTRHEMSIASTLLLPGNDDLPRTPRAAMEAIFNKIQGVLSERLVRTDFRDLNSSLVVDDPSTDLDEAAAALGYAQARSLERRFAAQIMDGTHLGPCGTAAADLARLEAEAIPDALPAMVERAVRKLNPYEGWERRTRNLLRTTSTARDDPDPSSWAETTARKHVDAIRAILRTADAAGLACSDFPDLRTAAVLDFLQHRLIPRRPDSDPDDPVRHAVERGNALPLPRRLGGVYLAGLLSSLRTCLHALSLDSSADLNARIAFFSKSERRSFDGRLFHKATYLRAAAALDAFGRIAEAIGEGNAARIRTGAALLAIAADGSPRRGEAGGVERQLVVPNPMSERPETKVYIKSATSKARRPRILWLRDPTAIQLVDRLRLQPNGDEPFLRLDRLPMSLSRVNKLPGGGQLFRWPNGEPMSVESLYGLLRKVTIMAVGQPASYNMLRRANAWAQRTTAGRSAQLGRSSRSTQTNAIYHPSMVHGSHSVLAAGRDRARAAAARTGYLVDVVNDPKPTQDF